MADVFVSYARSSEPQAKWAAEALRSRGYSVWIDEELPAHRTYADVIDEQLQTARAVLVLWSAEGARSQWVRAEADLARNAGKLVQMSADGTLPPIPFNQLQCADLNGWDGDTSRPGWKKVEASIAALTGEEEPTNRPQAAQPRRNSICVLPFANMSGDSEQEYFSDGISEDITTDLSKVSALAVTARNTAFTFKGSAMDVPGIARKLGVSHVLEGSVRKAGGRVRITAKLIDGASGDHVWAERYDRDLTDIFAIQDEISEAIVSALKLKLLPEEKKAIEQRGTTSAEAYNLYLLARQYWLTGNHGDRRREEIVARICARAVQIDPQYARAWALMAYAQATLHYGFGVDCETGEAAADRALSLDPAIPEAYCAIARRLSSTGRMREALAAVETGLRVDPDSWEANKEAGRVRMLMRDVGPAERHFAKAVEVMPTDYHGWGMLLGAEQALGNEEQLRRAAAKTVELAEGVLAQDPSNGAAISFGVAGLAALGEKDRAKEWIDRGLLFDPDNLNMRYNFACALVSPLDDPEGALQLLELVFQRATGTIAIAETDPELDVLRDDPRFRKMLADAKKRLGLRERRESIVTVEPTESTPPAAAEPLRS